MKAKAKLSIFDVDPRFRIAVVSCDARDQDGNPKTAEQVVATNPTLDGCEILPIASNRSLYAEAIERIAREHAREGTACAIVDELQGIIVLGKNRPSGVMFEKHRLLVLRLPTERMRFAYIFETVAHVGPCYRSFVGFMPGATC